MTQTAKEEEGTIMELELEFEVIDGLPSLTDTARHLSKNDDTQMQFNENSTFYSTAGRRHANQDTVTIEIMKFDSLTGRNWQMYAVYDGHGGRFHSAFLRDRLLKAIGRQLDKGMYPKQAISYGFAQVEGQLSDIYSYNTEEYSLKNIYLEGSTALVCLILDGMIYTAGLGDSQAVMLAKDGHITKLSNYHTFNRIEEFERVQLTGGLVLRCRNTLRLNGYLAVSRCFGHKNLHKWIIQQPELRETSITAEGGWLIIATDGFWNYNPQLSPTDRLDNVLLNQLPRYPLDDTTFLCIRL